mmetsp:Transcript_35/g.83  ORF Transcript_35/g.83 Transcript_35/m.83 type:complete len:222 (-) Transcript_35:607-1272(-)
MDWSSQPQLSRQSRISTSTSNPTGSTCSLRKSTRRSRTTWSTQSTSMRFLISSETTSKVLMTGLLHLGRVPPLGKVANRCSRVKCHRTSSSSRMQNLRNQVKCRHILSSSRTECSGPNTSRRESFETGRAPPKNLLPCILLEHHSYLVLINTDASCTDHVRIGFVLKRKSLHMIGAAATDTKPQGLVARWSGRAQHHRLAPFAASWTPGSRKLSFSQSHSR